MAIQPMLRVFAIILLVFCGTFTHAQNQPSDYQLGPGDNIRILVFQNPDMTLETRVSEQGTIRYPLIGTIKVGGLPAASAEKAIADALRNGGFLKEPHVNIILITMHGNSVSVLGQVGKPGLYPLETVNVRALEILAVAGGIAPDGGDVAVLTGTRDGKSFRREIDVTEVFQANGAQNDVIVAPGDFIYVGRAPVFYIYGEVQKPGAYRLERGMTVREALAKGGGPTVRGTERKLGLFRRGAGQSVETRSDLGEPVQPNDVFYVKESLF